jgi:hypothetical protein
MTEQQQQQQQNHPNYPPPQNYQIPPQAPPQVPPQTLPQVPQQSPTSYQSPYQPPYYPQYQPMPAPPVAGPRTADFSKIGGFLLTFIILQAVYAFSMLASFPGSLEDLLRGIVDKESLAGTIASLIAIVTLIAYSIIIIMAVLQVITRHSSFLRNFQISGIIACVGNFVVFIIKEFVHITQMFGNVNTYYYVSNIDYHWGLVMLAILWTIFWSLYFIRSARMMTFMSPDNPYTHDTMTPYVEKALFGKGNSRQD